MEDHHRQGAVLLAQGQNPTQVGQILPVDGVRLHLSLEGAVGDLLEHPLHGGVALELVGPFGGQGPQGALHGELFPAAVVEVQVKEQAGTQLGLRGLKNGVELVGGKGHIAHIDLAVVLVALEVEGGGLDEHHLRRLGFEGLSEVPVGGGQSLLRAGQHVAGQAGSVIDEAWIDVAVGVGAAQVEVVQAVLRLGQIGLPHCAVVHPDWPQSGPAQPQQQRGRQHEGGGEQKFFAFFHGRSP